MPAAPSLVTPDLRAILFDVDGTLYHAGALRRAVLRRFLLAHLTRPRRAWEALRVIRAYRRAQEILRSERAANLSLPADQLCLASRIAGVPERTAAECISRWFDVEPLPFLRRFARPGLHAFLGAASQRGFKLGVVSDYEAEHKLRAMGMRSYFTSIVSAQDPAVQRFKPDPAGLLLAAARLGVSPREVLYVGDRARVDARAAEAAGMRCVLIPAIGTFEKLGYLCGF